MSNEPEIDFLKAKAAAEMQAVIALYQGGQLSDAIERGEKLIAHYPQSLTLHDLLGKANHRLQRLEEAAGWFRKAAAIKPDSAEAHYALGATLQALGRMEEAAGSYERLLRIKPDHAEAHNNLGAAPRALGRVDAAIAHHQQAIRIRPDHALAHFNLGRALQDLGRMEDAIAPFEQALEIQPGFAEAANSLGSALYALRRMDAAVARYRQALVIRPDHAEAHNNLGKSLSAMGHRDEAVACYGRALAIRPDFFEAHNNLGVALQEAGRLDEAIACYGRALGLRPDHALTRSRKLHRQAKICDWQAIQAEDDLIASLGVAGMEVEPFTMLAFEDDPPRHKIRSEKFAAENYRLSGTFAKAPPPARPDRIRIGYFSADFHDHATMHLMAGMFERHDRDRFEVHVFSYGPDRDDAVRQRLREAVHSFHDVRPMGDKEVAELARLQGIDIAVDLKGYTGDGRLDMFAWRAAPVQMSYLGYPGTLGTPFIDYILADPVVIPPEQRHHVSEKIIFLPNSYQVNDDSRPISDRAMTRTEMGLPENGFVFCCFNNSFKISPAEFDIWMRLLGRVDGSVLWLLRANSWAEGNLREAAQKRGIDPARLIFADRMPLPEHLARHAQADLFLDTFNYGAHTTASDALWAGLPVVTRLGQGFAARVAASLLTAVGLPELIAGTSGDYESLALELAENPRKLTDIKEKLTSNRLTAPLFDTTLFTRHIEAAYEQAYQRYLEGKPAADIWV